jgi:hypothetical protein
MDPCERCGREAGDDDIYAEGVHYSVQLEARVCFRCYQLGTATFRKVEAVLDGAPKPRADIARTVGRHPKDSGVGKVVAKLKRDGLAARTPSGWTSAAPQA